LAWWMQARLRLAIEVDCDRRCLAGGTDTGTYGRLLIAAAGHTQSRLPWRAVAPAFATRRSHLERRLLAMTPATRRPRRALALAAGALSLVAGVAACESAAPTAAQVAAADASTVQATLVPTLADSNVTYVVNGRVVSAAEAKQVQAKDIATIAVAKRSDGAQVQIEIKDDRAPGERTPRATRTPGGSRTPALDQALIVIDGVVQENTSAMNALSPERIANVEILKGGAATALYDVSKYPKAANGVVKITTKR
ncbi:MAG: TonB-dependent receptor plug domain-containing protein, partial [Gemmatimonadaceae bacterium]|nr:TonB-dependent receptor plug domain-containing protein [Gemmatimonadaceae bacterium]